MGVKAAITTENLKSIVESTGAVLVSEEYVNNHSPIEFLCSKCKSPGKITWKHYCRGQNQTFLCQGCLQSATKTLLREQKRKFTVEQVREMFAQKGAELISTEYNNNSEPLWFKCSICGEPWHISLSAYLMGKNPDLCCYFCNMKKQGKRKLTLTDLQEFFKAGGSELYSKEYRSTNQQLEFKCKHCGGIAVYSYDQLMQRDEQRRFYCTDCLHGYRLKPTGNYGGNKRHLVDLQWFKYVYRFFNLTDVEQESYSAHHIKRYDQFPEFRTSLVNGYPIKAEYHDLGSVDPFTGLKNPFHVIDGYLNVVNYPEYVKLPYHTYSGFHFLDLNSKLCTEIIADKVDLEKDYLVNQFESFKERGILYVPLFFDEMFVDRRLNCVCSLIRKILYQWFPDVYLYTGQQLDVYSVQSCTVGAVDLQQAKAFYKVNGLNGFVEADFYLGLFSGNVLLQCVSCKKESYKFIISCVERLNTSVPDGLIKLLSWFIKEKASQSIEFHQDARFPLFKEELEQSGFVLLKQTEPNLYYFCKKTNRFFKDMKESSYWINKSLELGMSLDRQTLVREDYVKAYDLGEFVYVWSKD